MSDLKNDMFLENQLEQFREDYYNKNKKNTFFKKTQKNDCAEKVTQKFSLKTLLETSIFKKNHILYFNYPIIKTFIHPNIYQSIIDHIDINIKYLLENYNMIEINIDMKSFTVTAAQRYNDLIKLFCNKYLQEDVYVNRIQHIYIHNTPSVIEIIRKMFSPFMSSRASEKLIFFRI